LRRPIVRWIGCWSTLELTWARLAKMPRCGNGAACELRRESPSATICGPLLRARRRCVARLRRLDGGILAMRFGLLTLGDYMPPPGAERPTLSEAGRHRQFVKLCVAADQLGFDLAWLGEHHLNDYILSAPEVLLGAVAALTKRIRLGTGLTLLPTLDPLLVAEQFATLDVLSDGRVEFCVGRGIVNATYAHFGLDIANSNELLEEKIDLLLRLLGGGTVDWQGRVRAPLHGVRLRPAPQQRPHPPVWLGGGRSDHTLRLAARFGLPLVVPGIFAPPQAFVPMVARFRELWAEAGRDPAAVQLGLVAHCHVRDDIEDVHAAWAPFRMRYGAWISRLIYGSEKAQPPTPDGPDFYGSSAKVVERIGQARELLGIDTLFVKFDGGGLPEPAILASMDTFASRVMPAFRAGAPRA
jgi:alkanesulfonate monooxygenase SsuD/methylene tetrahydromethanopterin reductase-like flavin-dependent oxidoreductase (luciferase family)